MALSPWAWLRDSGVLIGALVAGLLLAGSLWALRVQQDSQLGARKASLRQSVAVAASLLQSDLQQALAAADSLELLIRTTGQVDGFDRLAQDLMQRNPLLTAVALAPGGVIRQVAPLDAQGALIGRRMFDDPSARADLQEAVRKRAMVVSQPQPLMAGGVGTVARLPVYRSGSRSNGRDSDASSVLWGFVLVQVRLPDVAQRLSNAGLADTDGRFVLTTMDSNSGHRIAFFPFPAPTLGLAESATIEMPQRRWSLAVELQPRAGSDGLVLKLAAALVSGTAGLLCAVLLRRRGMHQARRNFYRDSVPPVLHNEELDDSHRALERVRHLPGHAVMLVLRLPGDGRRAALVDAGHPLRTLLREPDLLLPLGGRGFLVVAHSLPSREVAAWVRDRLVAQARSLAGGGATSLQHRLFSQPQNDIRLLFAQAVAELHISAAAGPQAVHQARPEPAVEVGGAGFINPVFAVTRV